LVKNINFLENSIKHLTKLKTAINYTDVSSYTELTLQYYRYGKGSQVNGLPAFEQQLADWRQHLHRHPETGFEEVQTADFVAGVLSSFGLEVHRGIGGTGLVASLTIGDGEGVIGLRADMDALLIDEQTDGRPHRSTVKGKMHACGHDGHMTMVLGAAKLLCERRDFNGTVRFIFQPAEEHGRGAKAMLDGGLLERFPMDEIYGAHNLLRRVPAELWPVRTISLFISRVKERMLLGRIPGLIHC
jgi:metal-dependent amidase/aminoacylase/carboxypeptidase family protein